MGDMAKSLFLQFFFSSFLFFSLKSLYYVKLGESVSESDSSNDTGIIIDKTSGEGSNALFVGGDSPLDWSADSKCDHCQE